MGWVAAAWEYLVPSEPRLDIKLPDEEGGLWGAEGGQDVVLYPGMDQISARCQTVF